MARDDQPYLVSLDSAYSEEGNCFCAHSVPEGRKLDLLRTNPCVWDQVIEDHSYLPGQCSHAYRAVIFKAKAQFSEPIEGKSWGPGVGNE